MSCPLNGDFDVCEVKDGYVYALPATKNISQRISNDVKPKPEIRKSAAGALLLLITRLKEYETNGVDYSTLNNYFRNELGAHESLNPMSLGYMIELLTYDPKNDTAKTYASVFQALKNAPASLNWLEMWDIIDGLSTQ